MFSSPLFSCGKRQMGQNFRNEDQEEGCGQLYVWPMQELIHAALILAFSTRSVILMSSMHFVSYFKDLPSNESLAHPYYPPPHTRFAQRYEQISIGSIALA